MRPVLVVEDDPSTRDLMTAYLQLDGIAVITANNGLEGLGQLRKARPCLILLDLMMPVMDGLEFRRVQLNDPEFAQVPTILVTAVHNAAERAEELGVVGVLRKPFNLDDLLTAVENYCAEARAN